MIIVNEKCYFGLKLHFAYFEHGPLGGKFTALSSLGFNCFVFMILIFNNHDYLKYIYWMSLQLSHKLSTRNPCLTNRETK